MRSYKSRPVISSKMPRHFIKGPVAPAQAGAYRTFWDSRRDDMGTSLR